MLNKINKTPPRPKSVRRMRLSDDVRNEEGKEYGIYTQPLEDGIISYRIDGLYNDKGKINNSISLLKNPPILVFANNSEEEVHFTLTKKVTEDLSKSLDILDKKYKNIPIEEKFTLKDALNRNILDWPMKILVTIAAVLVLVITIVLS